MQLPFHRGLIDKKPEISLSRTNHKQLDSIFFPKFTRLANQEDQLWLLMVAWPKTYHSSGTFPPTKGGPSYFQHTTDFINKLQQLSTPQPSCFLVTLDVSSLYTNILHEERIAACREFLNSQESQVPAMADIFHLIQLVLSMNSFISNNTHYVQIYGTAMGTCMAPSYTNIFIGMLEHGVYWWHLCHMDPWQGPLYRFLSTISTITTFINNLNHYHSIIKFTATWSAEKVTFPNTGLYLKNNLIETNLNVNPPDRHQYLHMDSSHLKLCETAILTVRHPTSGKFVRRIKPFKKVP